MAQYETIPTQIRALQWDGTNLKDVLIFAGGNIPIPNLFTNYDDFSEYIKDKGGNIPLHEGADVNGRKTIAQGMFIIKCPSGKIEVVTPSTFLTKYREVQSNT